MYLRCDQCGYTLDEHQQNQECLEAGDRCPECDGADTSEPGTMEYLTQDDNE